MKGNSREFELHITRNDLCMEYLTVSSSSCTPTSRSFTLISQLKWKMQSHTLHNILGIFNRLCPPTAFHRAIWEATCWCEKCEGKSVRHLVVNIRTRPTQRGRVKTFSFIVDVTEPECRLEPRTQINTTTNNYKANVQRIVQMCSRGDAPSHNQYSRLYVRIRMFFLIINSKNPCPLQTAIALFLSFGFLGWYGRVSGLRSDGSFPLPQSLHLPCLQFAEVLFLHVQAAVFGTEGIVGDVLLLLGL